MQNSDLDNAVTVKAKAKKSRRHRGQLIEKGKGRFQLRVPRGCNASGGRIYETRTMYGTKREAEEALARLIVTIKPSMNALPSSTTVQEYVRDWLETRSKLQTAPKTHESYLWLAETYVYPRLGNRKLLRLTNIDVQHFIGDLVSSGLRPRTIRLAHSVLHNALSVAVDSGLMTANPATRVVRPKIEVNDLAVLNPKQAASLLAAASGTRFEALWFILLLGGLRPGEALALRWSDLRDGVLHVQRNLIALDGGKLSLAQPKTKSARRSIPLPLDARESLLRHKRKQASDRLAVGEKWNDDNLVFCNQHGGLLEWRLLVRRYWAALLRQARLPRMRPYDLRHSCATLMLMAGVNPKVVQERLGHAKIGITLDTYSHVLPSMQESATEMLQALVSAARA